MKTTNTTLLIVIQDDKLLLATKKRGFAKGKINGVGGKQQPGETIEEAMIRESIEEIGITPTNYQLRGILEFDEKFNDERQIIKMHVYTATEFDGTPTESNEMSPIWINKNNIPYDKMFGDDILWYPQMLEGKNFKGSVVFDDDYNITSHDIKFFDNEINIWL